MSTPPGSEHEGRPSTRPAEVLWELSDLATPWALRAAVGLGLAEAVRDGHDSLDRLAETTGAPRDALRRLVALLERRGVVTSVDGRVGLTDIGVLLLPEHPESRRDALDPAGIRTYLESSYAGLPDAMLGHGVAHDLVHGAPFWTALDRRPDLAARFDRHLDGWSAAWVEQVAADAVFEGAERIVDVGGGLGALALALARRHAGVDVVLAERSATAERAVQALASAEVGERVRVEPHDMFVSVPSGADRYVLAQVLHDWDDPRVVDVLRIVRGHVLISTARLVVVERLPWGESADFDSMDLLMFTLFGARERGVDEYRSLAGSAGFHLVGVRPVGNGLSLLEFSAAD